MEVGSPEWIEASLAKLDELEQQRSEHEAALESANDPLSLKEHNGALERLDAEIKALYTQLEAFDDEDEGEDEDEDEAAAAAAGQAEAEAEDAGDAGSETQADEHAAAEPPGGTLNDEIASASLSTPSPASLDANPFGSAGGGSGGGGFDAPAPVSFDDDLKPHGGGGKWVFLGLVLAGGLGVGGFFLWKNMEAQKQKDVKPTVGEEIKIEAAAIPDDTEAPNAVKGGDATISPTVNGNPTGRSSGGGSGGSGGGSSKKVEKSKKPIDLKGSGGDPLGGTDPLG